jgi:small-conductance mechanosensitive channel
MRKVQNYIPEWLHEWLDIVVPGLQILMIMVLATVVHHTIRHILKRVAERYQWPQELMVPILGVLRWVIRAGAFLMILERLGVSAAVLWTAFSSFAAVGAVAFFAVWSVLSNFYCALLIFTMRPFRLGDYIELIDSGEKPGIRGQVIEINMLYTVLQDFDSPEKDAWLQIPNTLIFQRVVRHWRTAPHHRQPLPHALPPADAGTAAEATAPAAATSPSGK